MPGLTGRTVDSTYQDLLRLENNNQGFDNNLRPVLTGDGDSSPLQLSTTKVNIQQGLHWQGEEITVSAAQINALGNVTTDDLQELIDSLVAQINDRVPFDYLHYSESDPTPSDGEDGHLWFKLEPLP